MQTADAAEVRKCYDLCLVISTHMPTELELSFVEVREKNVEQLKVLNRAIFPINYQVNVLACYVLFTQTWNHGSFAKHCLAALS